MELKLFWILRIILFIAFEIEVHLPMKRLMCVNLLFIFGINLYAQNQSNIKDKIFQSIGVSVFTDIDIMPLRDISYSKIKHNIPTSSGGTSDVQINFSGKYFGTSVSYFTFVYGLRYNIYEPTKDFSVSLYAPLALGLNMFLGSSIADPTNYTAVNKDYLFYNDESDFAYLGFLKLAIPLYLQVNYGNISTMATEKEKGITGGIGFEYQINPIFAFTMNGESNKNDNFTKSSFLIPSMNIGYRYWGKNSDPKEVNLKVGLGAVSTYSGTDGTTKTSAAPFSVMLSFHKYLGY